MDGLDTSRRGVFRYSKPIDWIARLPEDGIWTAASPQVTRFQPTRQNFAIDSKDWTSGCVSDHVCMAAGVDENGSRGRARKGIRVLVIDAYISSRRSSVCCHVFDLHP